MKEEERKGNEREERERAKEEGRWKREKRKGEGRECSTERETGYFNQIISNEGKN